MTRAQFTLRDGGTVPPGRIELRVVKVQLPVHPPGAAGLIYDEPRELLIHRFVPQRILYELGDTLKGYYRAHWRAGSDDVTLYDRVLDQNW